MRLLNINDTDLICESDASEAAITHMFKYLAKGDAVLHRHPHIVYLGDWNHRYKGTKQRKGTQGEQRKYVGGINLNYLNSNQMAELRSALPDILDASGLQQRYRRGAALLPHIFRGPKFATGQDVGGLPPSGAYRTYRVDSNDGVQRRFQFKTGKLLVLKLDKEDRLKAKHIAAEEGREWDELSAKEKAQYEEQAFRERGVEDEHRRKKAEKDRELVEPASDLEEPGPSRDDEIDVPETEKIPPAPPTPEPPPGRRLAPLEPGPGIEVPPPRVTPVQQPKRRGKAPVPQQKMTPTQTGGTNIANPQNLRTDQATPPSSSTNVVDQATQDPNEAPDDRSD